MEAHFKTKSCRYAYDPICSNLIISVEVILRLELVSHGITLKRLASLAYYNDN